MRSKFEATKLIKLGGLCGLVGSPVALLGVFAAIAVSPWFRWDTHALSQLGVGAAAPIFNGAVITGGVLTSLFAKGLREYLPRTSLTKIGTIMAMLGGASLALVGIFTLEYRLPHFVVSLGYFVLLPVGLVLIGAGIRGSNRIATPTITTGIAALLAIFGLALMFSALRLKVGFAVPEMAESLVLAAWTMAMGAKLVKR